MKGCYFKNEHFYPFAIDWQEQSHGKIVVPFSYRDGYHPGMQFHTALMAFVDGKLQGIIARTSARKS